MTARPRRAVAAILVALLAGPALGTPGPALAGPAPVGPAPVGPAPVGPAPVGIAIPVATGQQIVTATIVVSDVLDGALTRYVPVGLGDGDRDETQLPVIQLRPGATLRNAVIGAPGADGVHCEATCTLQNVWWEDVGEDAATLLGTAPPGSVMTVDGGGARLAVDKVFQHNGPGTMIIKNFQVDDFGKLYRSCGNCRAGYQGGRSVIVDAVTAQAGHVALVGINTNYGDTAEFSRITVLGDPGHRLAICQHYTGNNTGTEPTKTGAGPTNGCTYTPSDITYR